MLQKFSLGLILAGALLLGGWALKGFFGDPQIPLLIRIGVGAIGSGFVILLAALIRDRFIKSKEEKGEEKPKWLTTEFIPGKTIASSVGIVRGSAIRAKHLGKDIIAGLRGIVGGEITEYTEMMADAREEALKRMIEDATLIGANAIIGLRFGTAMVMQNAAEVIAYGTGVVLE